MQIRQFEIHRQAECSNAPADKQNLCIFVHLKGKIICIQRKLFIIGMCKTKFQSSAAGSPVHIPVPDMDNPVQSIMCCFFYINIILLFSAYGEALSQPKGILAPKTLIDLRSDTLTKPSPAMRKAMCEAEVGDDVFREDPTINKLEARVAAMFQKESSLFFPTGTMANLAASMSWCNSRGSEAIIGDCSHMYLYEQANLAQMAGISPRVLPNKADGTMSIDLIETVIRSENIHFPITSLISLENTHNYCGGRVLPKGYTESVCGIARRFGIPVHIDGARIWNAATAICSPVAELAAPADSITACLSKGLGAPAGSMLIGPKQFIDKARRVRKALGGGMRQVGVLAAAGLQALDDFEGGMLLADHRKAHAIAESLSEIPGIQVDPSTVDSNIILVHLESELEQPAAFAAKLREAGVLVLPFGPRSVRIVTHRDVAEEDVPAIVWAFRDVAAKVWAASPAGERGLVLPSLSQSADYADKSNSRHHEQQVLDSVTLTVDGSTAAEFSFIPVEDGDASDAVAAAAWAEAERQSEALVEHTQNEVQNGVQNLTESGSGAPQYEVVTVRGMSVSDEGFCVILQQQQQQQQGRVTPSPTPRRCVRVLVTPEDPMSDGLDHDEVESSEAVTLLQLLQGIDVETYLSKDALATKFSAALHSKNGGSVSKYDLKAVLLNDVGRGKEFQAALAGSLRAPGNHSTTSSSSNGFTSDSTSTALDASNIGNRTAEGFSTTAEQPKKASKRQQHSADDSDMSSEAPSVDVYSSGFGIILPGAPIMLGTPTAENESITSASTSATTSFSSSTSPSSAGAGGAGAGSGKSTFDVEVPIESSFYAIALALRHQVPIEVRCELLQDDRKSFPEQELDTLFPKLLATTAPAAPSGSFAGGTQSQSPVQQQQQQAQMQMQAQAHNKEGKDVKEVKEGKRPSLENLKKRLAEAIRQRNEEKIAQLQESISDFVTSATATATAGLGAAGGMPELPELATH